MNYFNFFLTKHLLCALNSFLASGDLSSANNLCLSLSGSKLFDTQMVFLKELLETVSFGTNHQTTKKHKISQLFTTVKPKLFEVPGTAGILSNNR